MNSEYGEKAPSVFVYESNVEHKRVKLHANFYVDILCNEDHVVHCVQSLFLFRVSLACSQLPIERSLPLQPAPPSKLCV